MNYRKISEYLDELRSFWENQTERIVLKIQPTRTISEGVNILKQYIQAEPRLGKIESTPDDILRLQMNLTIRNLKNLNCGDLPPQPKEVKEFLKGSPILRRED